MPTTSITVSLTWKDVDNADGIRPDSVTLALYANGENTGLTVTLSGENDWTSSFGTLNRYDENDEEITYSVEVVTIDGMT